MGGLHTRIRKGRRQLKLLAGLGNNAPADKQRRLPAAFSTVDLDTGEWFYADYDSITIASEVDKYRWHFGTYQGNAGDALRYDTADHLLEDMMFTTCDSDNDRAYGENCACVYTGGWWMNYCFEASLTGNSRTDDYDWLAVSQPSASYRQV